MTQHGAEITANPGAWRRCPATYVALATVLLIYPGFRMAVVYFDLFPDPGGRIGWWSTWGVILVGHWVCAVVVLAAIASEQGGLASVGLDLSLFSRRRLWWIGIVILACVVAYSAPSYFYGDVLPVRMRSHPLGPISAAERVFWVLMAVTAGFVEELAYRGYAITRLRRLMGLPLALLLSVAAFALMHGPSVFELPLLALYLVSGLLFSLIFLRLGSTRLEVLMVAHVAIDLMLVAAP